MANDGNTRRLFYEQSVLTHSSEANLLFSRLNFFLAGMSFLVAALVLVLAQWKSGAETRSFTYFSIVALGWCLSFLFVLTNLFMTKVVKRLRDHVWRLGEELGVEAPLNTLKFLEPDNQKFDQYLKQFNKCCRRLFRWHRDFPAFHTWVIPLFFLMFWQVMVDVYLVEVWHRGLWWWSLMAVPFVFGLFTICLVKKCTSKGVGNAMNSDAIDGSPRAEEANILVRHKVKPNVQFHFRSSSSTSRPALLRLLLMNNFWKLWIGIAVLVSFTVAFFFVGRAVWGDQAFASNYAASIAGAGLGAALSLIVVMVSLTITQQQRQKDLSYARFAFLRRQGERLWRAYVAFCQHLEVNSVEIGEATWNSANRALWPEGAKALELHRLLKERTTVVTSSPGGSAIDLMDAYDDVFTALSDTAIFEGEHSLARDITEAWRHFGWACAKVRDYQGKMGWAAQNWPQISEAIEQTSESVCKTISSLDELSAKVRIE